ncbi:NAD(P)H-dependent oxidoreductase [Candidatus Mycobacterium wuenschmannii]|uniref:NAD(P)H-dependent oxidoreductase n=1 Tax=Candidatus Mycobacterium wuenschmannii TaxID=3027808 RepID=A0ABY8VSY1_9MYCO|nr:NAD(P)H-dependent oxidoreductase [Candidatus Mycobacterium wuenschmannii]WIM86733.1 NAD(P)H-dependent oxidoreductase [Candidatus Mycobacterium wuenschmannii]
MKIGIIVGSIREGRKGLAVGQWVAERAGRHGDAQFELIDLKEFDLPLLTSAVLPAMADRKYDSQNVTRWSQAIDGCDAFVFVSPEYNHGVPGAFKNAFDSIGSEWNNKPVAFVAYGGDGGIRSIQQWRQIVANFEMLDVRGAVALSLFNDFNADGFAPQDRRSAELDTALQQLVSLTAKVRA